MDLVGIMHVVDMPLAGKRDFNYLCSWFDIVHSDLDFLPLHNVHPMSLIGPCLFMVWFRLVVSRALALVFVWWLFSQNQDSMFMFLSLILHGLCSSDAFCGHGQILSSIVFHYMMLAS